MSGDEDETRRGILGQVTYIIFYINDADDDADAEDDIDWDDDNDGLKHLYIHTFGDVRTRKELYASDGTLIECIYR